MVRGGFTALKQTRSLELSAGVLTAKQFIQNFVARREIILAEVVVGFELPKLLGVSPF